MAIIAIFVKSLNLTLCLGYAAISLHSAECLLLVIDVVKRKGGERVGQLPFLFSAL